MRHKRDAIDAVAAPISWIRPRDAAPDRLPIEQAVASDTDEEPEAAAAVGAGRVRGLPLHRLMKEVLGGELPDGRNGFAARAAELIHELAVAQGGAALPDPAEVAATAWRIPRLPKAAALRRRLVPEWPV